MVLYHLLGGTKRLGELQRLLPNCSQKVLIQQLRDLEAHGLVQRHAFADTQRVDYSPTPLGLSLEPLMLLLCEWGQRHAAELDELDRITDCIVKPVHTARQPTAGH